MRFLWTVKFISWEITIGTENPITKKVLCVEQNNPDTQYPDSLAFDFLKEKAEMLQGIAVWDVVEVMYNSSFKISEAKNSVFNSIRGWKVKIMKAGAELAQEQPDDNLPF